ncbi:hypothetical protein SMACR_07007 [Sordaria macrospora]|uniref:WGS project CABT00000000 data, contig 2.29 n=2 Tax=Sordaria macrospora TaxID=5147 RepID=F7W512_SORMK|nr:uncharacterized protein SMAC_07007 [Sordaria macrospora k-hell]KAA8632138.1 hypothetical protein SMACR_07007 [Sordaria macrospora]WPJ67172.1 hypothetical protein SMAC4_07007 [Sordaria macrospora]CCC12600.1 unnamed protein product [Sordaria macrospora k-hell]
MPRMALLPSFNSPPYQAPASFRLRPVKFLGSASTTGNHSPGQIDSGKLQQLLHRDAVNYDTYVKWYASFLDQKIGSLPHRFIPLTLPRGSLSVVEHVFNCLSSIVPLIKDEPSVCLGQMLEKLRDEHLVDDIADDHGIQFVFICFGLLTFLYSPKLDPAQGKLEIEDEERIPPRHTLVILEVEEYRNLPMTNIVRDFSCFGRRGLAPMSSVREDDRPGTYSGSLPMAGRTSLFSLNVNYYTLSKLSKIEIEWTDIASKHLELDARYMVLYLFRHPSFCVLMCPFNSNTPPGCYIDLFFNNCLRGRDDEPNITASDFYREILGSYRVLFSQDKNSWKAYQSSRRKEWSRGSGLQICPDDLLDGLCGKNWRDQPIYDLVGLEPAKSTYYHIEDEFPLLGRRLLELQEFVMSESPVGWKGLWWDRRDTGRYWTFWGFVWISFITLVLGLLQIALAILQVWSGFK